MNFIKYLICIVLFFSFWRDCIFSQTINAEIDSLERKLKIEKIDTLKIYYLNVLATLTKSNETKKSKKYAEDALKISYKINYLKGKVYAYNNLGNAYYFLSKYDSAYNCYDSVLRFSETRKDSIMIASAYNNLASVNYAQGRYTFDSVHYKKALKNYQLSLIIRTAIKDSAGIAGSLNNIGNVFGGLGAMQEDGSLIDSSIFYYEKAIPIKQFLKDSSSLARTIMNLGTTYQVKGTLLHEPYYYEKALDYLQKSRLINEKIMDNYGTYESLTNIAYVYLDLKKYQMVIQTMEKALVYTELLDNDKDLKKFCYEILYATYDSLKDYKLAYKYLTEFDAIKDSIFNETNNKQILEFENKYQIEKKEHQNKLLIKEAEKQKLIKRIFLITSIILIIWVFVLLFILKKRKRLFSIRITNLKISALFKNEQKTILILIFVHAFLFIFIKLILYYFNKTNEIISAIYDFSNLLIPLIVGWIVVKHKDKNEAPSRQVSRKKKTLK